MATIDVRAEYCPSLASGGSPSTAWKWAIRLKHRSYKWHEYLRDRLTALITNQARAPWSRRRRALCLPIRRAQAIPESSKHVGSAWDVSARSTQQPARPVSAFRFDRWTWRLSSCFRLWARSDAYRFDAYNPSLAHSSVRIDEGKRNL